MIETTPYTITLRLDADTHAECNAIQQVIAAEDLPIRLYREGSATLLTVNSAIAGTVRLFPGETVTISRETMCIQPSIPSERGILAHRYKCAIGYDPFLDDPEISEDEVRQTLQEFLDEAAAAA